METITELEHQIAELRAKLKTAANLLRVAECTGETYKDIRSRSRWRMDRETICRYLPSR